jgi:phage terminase large subunit-like protein
MLNASPAQLLASLPAAAQQKALEELDDETRAHLAYHWPFWARTDQVIPEGNWTYWLILAGRGWGKTRTGAETVRQWVKTSPIVNLIGATVDDARDIMIEGEPGRRKAGLQEVRTQAGMAEWGCVADLHGG